MDKKRYLGHESQLFGVEEHRLIGGKGDGMRLFQVRNGLGLELTVSADRGADISRLTFKGDNYCFISPVGYVAPSFYKEEGIGFLKSFTAGFLTTCGLSSVGNPCEDMGESLPLHGTISNTPADYVYYEDKEDSIIINAKITDAEIFAKKLVMNRKIIVSKERNVFKVMDEIRNNGHKEEPLMILYHMNMGYPLLSEESEVFIPSNKVIPRDEHASNHVDAWHIIEAPVSGFTEQCFYHEFNKEALAAIYNHELNKGIVIRYDKNQLDYFTEWKMLGEQDYVLGIEPGNCHPDGRDKMREDQRLKFIQPKECVKYFLEIEMVDGLKAWKEIKENSL